MKNTDHTTKMRVVGLELIHFLQDRAGMKQIHLSLIFLISG